MNFKYTLPVAAMLASAAFAQTKWDLPAAYPATNFHSENLVQFANDVDKASGGKLKITVKQEGATILVGRPGSPESADPLLPALVIAGAFGFAVAAMLVPLVSEFDVALGRTSGGAD